MSQNAVELDQLLTRCRHGDEQALTELLRQSDPAVTRWLARLDYTLRAPDLEDLRQEVFIKVLHALPVYRGQIAFQAWLYRQTESIVIDARRKRSASKRKAPDEVVGIDAATAEERPVDPPDQRPSPDELAARQDEHRLLFAALEKLGPPESSCRQLIGLSYFGGFKYEEIAQTLNMNPHTVSSTLSKCLARLREIATTVFSESNSVWTTTAP